MELPKLIIVLSFLLNVVLALDFDCTDIEQGVLNIHPTECHSFVICINGNPVASPCPSGMHFNFEIQNCISGDCEDVTPTEDTTTSEITTFSTTTETTMEQTTTTEETTSETTTEETTTEEITSEETTTEETTPEETTTEATTTEESSTTEDTTTEETTTTQETTIEQTTTTEEITEDTTTTQESTTTQEITTEVDTTTTTTTTEPEVTTTDLPETPTPNPEVEDGIECPRDRPNDIIFIPSKINCERYYICNSGNIYPMWCREGLHFNRITDQCDYPELAECVLDTDSGEVDADGIPLCNKNIDMYYLPHPHKCAYFIFCLAGNRYISSCPLYKSWDINLEQCVDSSFAICAPGAQ